MNAHAENPSTLEKQHHPDCHYDPLYCDGQLCWQAAENEQRAMAAIARYAECPECGLPCDGGCNERDEENAPAH